MNYAEYFQSEGSLVAFALNILDFKGEDQKRVLGIQKKHRASQKEAMDLRKQLGRKLFVALDNKHIDKSQLDGAMKLMNSLFMSLHADTVLITNCISTIDVLMAACGPCSMAQIRAELLEQTIGVDKSNVARLMTTAIEFLVEDKIFALEDNHLVDPKEVVTP